MKVKMQITEWDKFSVIHTYLTKHRNSYKSIKIHNPVEKKRQKIRTISHKRRYSNGHQSYERFSHSLVISERKLKLYWGITTDHQWLNGLIYRQLT